MKVKAKITVTYEIEVKIDPKIKDRRIIEDVVREHWDGLTSVGLEGEYYNETEIDIIS